MIHTSIPDDGLPVCLRRKLVFGDREQIQALKDIERELDEVEQREKAGLVEYNVRLEWRCEIDVDVWAKSEQEAKEIAIDENPPDDFDLDYVRVKILKK